MWETIGIWIAAGLTLCVFSFLYKDNPFYKFAEHLYIGLSVGYTIAQTWDQAIIKYVWYPIKEDGNYYVLIPAAIGLLMFSRFIPKYRWLIRWPLAFMIGISAGASIPRTMDSMIFKQMQATIQPLSSINLIIIALGLLFTLLYFFFSVLASLTFYDTFYSTIPGSADKGDARVRPCGFFTHFTASPLHNRVDLHGMSSVFVYSPRSLFLYDI